MPRYDFGCPRGETREVSCSLGERNDSRTCPEHGEPLRRLLSVPTVLFPRALYTQWYDVFDKSPREMAHDKNIERYEPGRPDRSEQGVQSDRAGIQQAWETALATHGRPEGSA